MAPISEIIQYVPNLKFPILTSGLNKTDKSTKSAVIPQTETVKIILTHQNTKTTDSLGVYFYLQNFTIRNTTIQ